MQDGFADFMESLMAAKNEWRVVENYDGLFYLESRKSNFWRSTPWRSSGVPYEKDTAIAICKKLLELENEKTGAKVVIYPLDEPGW